MEVFCKVNLTHPSSKGYNASNIDFIFTKAAIPRDQIEKNVINETTAVIRVRNMNASNPFLQCVLKRPSGKIQLVCQNQIDVGCKWSFVWIFYTVFLLFSFNFLQHPHVFQLYYLPYLFSLCYLFLRYGYQKYQSTITIRSANWDPIFLKLVMR